MVGSRALTAWTAASAATVALFSVGARAAGKAAPEEDPRGSYTPLVVDVPPRTRTRTLEPTEDIDWYTGYEPARIGPGLRFAPGLGYRFGDRGKKAAFNLDVLAGGRLGLQPGDGQWVLVPEAGLGWWGTSSVWWTVGVGLGHGEGDFRDDGEGRAFFGGISYIPRALFTQTQSGNARFGFRHDILLDQRETTLALNAWHAVIPDGAELEHRVGLAVSVDLGLVALLLILD